MPRELLLIAGLISAAAVLPGYIIEPAYHHHGWWGWHHCHHGYDDR